MGANIWPVDAVTGAPSYTGRMLRQTAVSALTGMGSTARPLGGKSGIRPGTPSSITAVTSTAWTVQPFAGVIDGEANAAAGAYGYAFDTAQTGTIAAAGSAARVDRLDVQVSDPSEGDGTSTPSIQIVYTQGAATGGATPAAPARSHRLCLIAVPASGGGNPTVTWLPDWSSASLLVANTVAELNGYTNIPPGQQAQVVGDVATANGPYIWSGSVWLFNGVGPVVNVTTFSTGWNPTPGSSKYIPRVIQQGNTVYLVGSVTSATGYSLSSILTIPAAFQPPTTAIRFVGAGVTSSGQPMEYALNGGVLQIPPGYGGTTAVGTAFPLNLFWTMD